MTQEKDLLLKYLCAALPYHVFVHSCIGNDYELREVNVYTGSFGGTCVIPIPYLRSMLSMTEEEKDYIENRWGADNYGDINTYSSCEGGVATVELADIVSFLLWLLEHHFDFMGLIPKNLAIEVTESNNPYK